MIGASLVIRARTSTLVARRALSPVHRASDAQKEGTALIILAVGHLSVAVLRGASHW